MELRVRMSQPRALWTWLKSGYQIGRARVVTLLVFLIDEEIASLHEESLLKAKIECWIFCDKDDDNDNFNRFLESAPPVAQMQKLPG